MSMDDGELMGCGVILFVFWVVVSWFTHIIHCFMNDQWGFLIAGAIVAPIGWIHGTGIWLGIW